MPLAYGIFSGGLDSMLAARLLVAQGVTVRLLTFVTPFFGAERALASGRIVGCPVRAVDITEEHLTMMEKPKHGFGRFMNPCIDCHALMFRAAGRIMEEEGGDFLFSGEVLGQRPKSQVRRALEIVARESGYESAILRPLSALNLPPTRMELEGLVNRELLLGLSGRTRKPQMELAERYGFSDYPTPAGGCLLTDPGYSGRLKEWTGLTSRLRARDMELLKVGRQFRLPEGAKLIVGRNQGENVEIERLARAGDYLLKADRIPGPSVLAFRAEGADLAPEDLEWASSITLSYSDALDGQTHGVWISGPQDSVMVEAKGRPKAEFVRFMV